MNGSTASIQEICNNLNKVKVPENTRGEFWSKKKFSKIFTNFLVVVGASPCYLSATKAAITNDKVKVSAQNCYKAEKGAFTGEVAPEMLK